VGDVAVLGHVEAHADGGRIAGADLNIDIAHRAIERAGAAILRACERIGFRLYFRIEYWMNCERGL
jgi:hypothetical protein